jgi:hypothetical protein
VLNTGLDGSVGLTESTSSRLLQAQTRSRKMTRNTDFRNDLNISSSKKKHNGLV